MKLFRKRPTTPRPTVEVRCRPEGQDALAVVFTVRLGTGTTHQGTLIAPMTRSHSRRAGTHLDGDLERALCAVMDARSLLNHLLGDTELPEALTAPLLEALMDAAPVSADRKRTAEQLTEHLRLRDPDDPLLTELQAHLREVTADLIDHLRGLVELTRIIDGAARSWRSDNDQLGAEQARKRFAVARLRAGESRVAERLADARALSAAYDDVAAADLTTPAR